MVNVKIKELSYNSNLAHHHHTVGGWLNNKIVFATTQSKFSTDIKNPMVLPSYLNDSSTYGLIKDLFSDASVLAS